MWVLERLVAGFGVPAGRTEDGALVWPERGLAVALSAAAAEQWRRQGWRVVDAGRSLTSLVAAVVKAAAEFGAQVDEDAAVRRAVVMLVAAHGVTSVPHVARDGRAVSWLDHRLAITMPKVSPGPLRQAGFTVFPVADDVDAALVQIRAAALAILAGDSAGDATNPSSHEQRLMKSLLASGLPPPVRDLRLRREDGSVYSQPDFAWPDVRLIVDLDGWFFHAADALDIILAAGSATEAQSALRTADRVRFVQDAKKRRRAASEGWTVVTVTDVEIDRDGPQPAVREIVAVYRRLAVSDRGLSPVVPVGSVSR